MPSINNFFGNKKTVGKIFYQESLKYGLRLIITQQYINEGNDTLVFEAGICDQIHESGSIHYYMDSYEWCSNSKEYVNHIKGSVSETFMPVVPSYKKEIEEEEYITESGITIKRCVEDLREVEGGKVWKYTWRAIVGKDKLMDIIITK